MIEFADHLHEHLVTPARVECGRYRVPDAPGGGGELTSAALAEFGYPGGPAWRGQAAGGTSGQAAGDNSGRAA